LTRRVQEKLAAAADEARRNATAPTTATTAPAAQRGRAPRRARLRLTRIDPWSVMKTAFLLSVALGIVMVVAVAIIWGVLGAAGVWDSVNRTVQDIVGNDSTTTFNVKDYVGTARVLGFTMIVAVVDVVLLTAVATLAAFLYNMAAALLGGVEVTLAEDN
jgi:ABC-type sugar transport system permease subunit